MMVTMPGYSEVLLGLSPDTRKGYQELQFEVVEAWINAQWYAMKKRFEIAYNVELGALAKALARADWLAHGGN